MNYIKGFVKLANKNLIICFIFSFDVVAAPITGVFALGTPNRFWPNTTMDIFIGGLGNQIQQTTAANNPDVFCESQGAGYRLPSLGEFNTAYRSYNFGHNRGVLPAHWSNYFNNDITKARLSDLPGRVVSGGLANEWGVLTSYSTTWAASAVNNRFWVTELANAYSGNDSSYGRWSFSSSSIAVVPMPIIDRYTSAERSNNLAWGGAVACVRDLVVTPSTLNPSKS